MYYIYIYMYMYMCVYCYMHIKRSEVPTDAEGLKLLELRNMVAEPRNVPDIVILSRIVHFTNKNVT